MQGKARVTAVLTLNVFFVAMTLLAAIFAQVIHLRDTRQLATDIRTQHLPAVEKAWDLPQVLQTLRTDLKDAAAEQNINRLEDTDSIRDDFLRLLDSDVLKHAPQTEDIRPLFLSYYQTARDATVGLAENGYPTQAVLSNIQQVHELGQTLDDSLEQLRETTGQQMDESLRQLENRSLGGRMSALLMILFCSTVAAVLAIAAIVDLRSGSVP